MRRFLGAATGTRSNAACGTLEWSKIFVWVWMGFERGGKSVLGHAGFAGVGEVGARYAELPAASEADRALRRGGKAPVVDREHDRNLNDSGR